jgi:hypothetical protein
MRLKFVENQEQGFMSIIPATWEVEIKKIMVRSQSEQKVSKTPISTMGCVCTFVIPAT